MVRSNHDLLSFRLWSRDVNRDGAEYLGASASQSRERVSPFAPQKGDLSRSERRHSGWPHARCPSRAAAARAGSQIGSIPWFSNRCARWRWQVNIMICWPCSANSSSVRTAASVRS